MSKFNLQIVSFDKVLLDEQTTHCAIFTEKGKIGFKAGHESFVSVLKENSAIEYNTPSEDIGKVQIRNGIFTFKNNKCTVSVFLF